MINTDTVLIIDDEPEICFLLSSMLKKKKLQPSIAHTINEGNKKLQEQPGILFLDINLPDGSGLDLLKKIRKEFPAMKIIMISAYDGEMERAEAMQWGADAFIGKPFTSDVVLKTINELAISA